MSDPTVLVDRTAPAYAAMMGEEDWDSLSLERQIQWRQLAFRVYELHIANKLEGFSMAIQAVEGVQVAPSTPKSWLRGAQEAKNALVWLFQGMREDVQTSVEVPEFFPEDLMEEDPHKDLHAGDEAPEIVPEAEWCGAQHVDNWTCSRRKHPSHWVHWDSSADGLMDDDVELHEIIDHTILATWTHDDVLDTIHPALGDLE